MAASIPATSAAYPVTPDTPAAASSTYDPTTTEVDLTGLATDDWIGDGTKSVGGVTWTLDNGTSGDVDTLGVTNGTGLQIAAKANKTLTSSTRTAPVVRFDLADYGYDDPRQRVVLVAQIASHVTASSQTQQLVVGIESADGFGNAGADAFAFRRANGDNSSFQRLDDGTASNDADDAIITDVRVVVLDWCAGTCRIAYHATTAGYDAPFGDGTAARTCSIDHTPVEGQTAPKFAPASVRGFFAVNRGLTDDAFTMVVEKFKIIVFPDLSA